METPATAAVPDPKAHLQHRVLVVDDEAVIVESLGQTLGREGYPVMKASTAEEAVAYLEKEEFSLILTDQKMPGMSGLELLSRAKAVQPDATRVLMTGVLDLDTVVEAINQGEIYRFIVKPWMREELLATVTNAVQRYDLIRRNQDLQNTTQTMNRRLEELNRSLEGQVARDTEQNHRLAALNHSLKENLQQSVELCVSTMKAFYPSLGVEAQRVYEVCGAMADSLKLPAEQRQILEIAAWLHDIGLVGVPRRLISLWQSNPRELNVAELALIKQHPETGQKLAGFVKELSGVGTVIRAHHERFDGGGYPDGLAGESIPWLGRLLAVAVGFAEGAYEGWDSVGVENIQKESGKAFDPEAVRLFSRCRPRAGLPTKQRQILLSEMESGMVLANGIYAPNGMLLIPDGKKLDDPSIGKLRNHNRVNPILQTLVVYC